MINTYEDILRIIEEYRNYNNLEEGEVGFGEDCIEWTFWRDVTKTLTEGFTLDIMFRENYADFYTHRIIWSPNLETPDDPDAPEEMDLIEDPIVKISLTREQMDNLCKILFHPNYIEEHL